MRRRRLPCQRCYEADRRPDLTVLVDQRIAARSDADLTLEMPDEMARVEEAVVRIRRGP